MTRDGEAGVSMVTDHPFRPRREWWTPCATCGLGEAAHEATVHVDYCAECGDEMRATASGLCAWCTGERS